MYIGVGVGREGEMYSYSVCRYSCHCGKLKSGYRRNSLQCYSSNVLLGLRLLLLYTQVCSSVPCHFRWSEVAFLKFF